MRFSVQVAVAMNPLAALAFAPQPILGLDPGSASGFGPGLTDGLSAYAFAFSQGVLVDFTPCVYPLIPITVAVFGAKGVSRGRALLLASAYVLGMATLYTSLGVGVALSSESFGAWLANPVVVYGIAAVMVALAASMFGAFDLQLPTSMQNRLNTVGGTGLVGAFSMGLVSGLLSAPCTGPVLANLLLFIAKSSAEGKSVFYGGSLLFTYALGMGTLFFAVALGASLFKPGPWMEHIKSFFGIAMLVMALWFLRPIHPEIEMLLLDPAWGVWASLAIVAAGLALGALHLSFKVSGQRVRKGVGVAAATVGATLALNHVLYVPPMDWHEVDSPSTLLSAVETAESEGKPLLIDFSAAWCGPCKEMELETFHDEAVEAKITREFYLIKVDVTQPTDATDTVQRALGSMTLPSVLVYDSSVRLSEYAQALHDGAPVPAPTVHFNTFVKPGPFLEALASVR